VLPAVPSTKRILAAGTCNVQGKNNKRIYIEIIIPLSVFQECKQKQSHGEAEFLLGAAVRGGARKETLIREGNNMHFREISISSCYSEFTEKRDCCSREGRKTRLKPSSRISPEHQSPRCLHWRAFRTVRSSIYSTSRYSTGRHPRSPASSLLPHEKKSTSRRRGIYTIAFLLASRHF
jgi:hypothetical protein